METNTIIWISLAAAFFVLLVFDMKIFFYKRTMHKIHMYSGLNTADIYGIAAPNMVWGEFLVRILKWGILIALLFSNWIVAIVCAIIGFILPMVLPEEDDYKNMMKMRQFLKGNLDPKAIALDNIIREIMAKQGNE